MDEKNQEPEVPTAGTHLWEWFFDINERISRSDLDRGCRRLPPTEWVAWGTLTGHVVYSWEYDILAAMDAAYCSAVNEEIEAGRALEQTGGT